LIASALLALAIVPGTRERKELNDATKWQESRHGWPLTFAVRKKPLTGLPVVPLSAWKFNDLAEVHFLSLGADLVLAFLVLAAVAVPLELRARRRPGFRFSLTDAFAVLTLVAIGCGWFAKYYAEYQQTQALLPLLKTGAQSVELAEGPFRFFDRITEIHYGLITSRPEILIKYPAALRELRAITFYRDPDFAKCLPLLDSLPGPIVITITYTVLTETHMEMFKLLPRSSCLLLRATNLTPKAILEFHAVRPDVSVILVAERFNPKESVFK
jgi:hypothetical protein